MTDMVGLVTWDADGDGFDRLAIGAPANNEVRAVHILFSILNGVLVSLIDVVNR